MIGQIIHSDNPLIKYGLSSLIIFGTLYFLASIGVPGTFLFTIIFAIGFAMYVAQNGLTFRI